MLKIVGAGMAGLLAARMLSHRDPVVYEAQDKLPNNHSAVLRFRTPLVGEILGIPFRKVEVIKAVHRYKNPIADALAYSMKTNSHYRTDRSLPKGVETVTRYIAPPDLIERMARGVNIEYGKRFDLKGETSKVISTIPMPDLVEALGPLKFNAVFNYVPGRVVTAKVIDCHAHASLYFPDPRIEFYRASITGDELIVEMAGKKPHTWSGGDANYEGCVAMAAAQYLGIDSDDLHHVELHEQRYAKIAPINEHVRKSVIFHVSSVMGKAFSLGRFATWRPHLLMDDLIKDIRLIDSWIESGTPGYDMDLHYGRK